MSGIPPQWFKSSYSENAARLEVAVLPHAIHIRDSKTPEDAPTLRVSPTTWTAFLKAAH
ncbi:DUF397 domain-containing protein [Streptomyces sp. NPDC048419]|uniref:DUF397 domain-containing protein n=1 Tax=Streptomyces sp. NPDC048419 TaxID=3365547 RepID=UPI003723DD43